MRRLVGWTAGVVGVAALARMLARRRAHPVPPAPALPKVDDRAEALRRKLDETRGADPPEPEEPEERPAAEPSAPQASLEERRARVHAKAQEAIEAMQEEPLP